MKLKKNFTVKVKNLSQVKAFIKWCIDNIGPGWHPDSDFSEYIIVLTKKTLFNKTDIRRLNKKLNNCFDYVEKKKGSNDYIYDYGMELLEKI